MAIFNPNIGRRTGVDVKAGKNIKILPNGFEDFEDYWTDKSDAEDESLQKLLAEVGCAPESEKKKPSTKLPALKVRSMSPFSSTNDLTGISTYLEGTQSKQQGSSWTKSHLAVEEGDGNQANPVSVEKANQKTADCDTVQETPEKQDAAPSEENRDLRTSSEPENNWNNAVDELQVVQNQPGTSADRGGNGNQTSTNKTEKNQRGNSRRNASVKNRSSDITETRKTSEVTENVLVKTTDGEAVQLQEVEVVVSGSGNQKSGDQVEGNTNKKGSVERRLETVVEVLVTPDEVNSANGIVRTGEEDGTITAKTHAENTQITQVQTAVQNLKKLKKRLTFTSLTPGTSPDTEGLKRTSTFIPPALSQSNHVAVERKKTTKEVEVQCDSFSEDEGLSESENPTEREANQEMDSQPSADVNADKNSPGESNAQAANELLTCTAAVDLDDGVLLGKQSGDNSLQNRGCDAASGQPETNITAVHAGSVELNSVPIEKSLDRETAGKLTACRKSNKVIAVSAKQASVEPEPRVEADLSDNSPGFQVLLRKKSLLGNNNNAARKKATIDSEMKILDNEEEEKLGNVKKGKKARGNSKKQVKSKALDSKEPTELEREKPKRASRKSLHQDQGDRRSSARLKLQHGEVVDVNVPKSFSENKVQDQAEKTVEGEKVPRKMDKQKGKDRRSRGNRTELEQIEEINNNREMEDIDREGETDCQKDGKKEGQTKGDEGQDEVQGEVQGQPGSQGEAPNIPRKNRRRNKSRETEVGKDSEKDPNLKSSTLPDEPKRSLRSAQAAVQQNPEEIPPKGEKSKKAVLPTSQTVAAEEPRVTAKKSKTATDEPLQSPEKVNDVPKQSSRTLRVVLEKSPPVVSTVSAESQKVLTAVPNNEVIAEEIDIAATAPSEQESSTEKDDRNRSMANVPTSDDGNRSMAHVPTSDEDDFEMVEERVSFKRKSVSRVDTRRGDDKKTAKVQGSRDEESPSQDQSKCDANEKPHESKTVKTKSTRNVKGTVESKKMGVKTGGKQGLKRGKQTLTGAKSKASVLSVVQRRVTRQTKSQPQKAAGGTEKRQSSQRESLGTREHSAEPATKPKKKSKTNQQTKSRQNSKKGDGKIEDMQGDADRRMSQSAMNNSHTESQSEEDNGAEDVAEMERLETVLSAKSVSLSRKGQLESTPKTITKRRTKQRQFTIGSVRVLDHTDKSYSQSMSFQDISISQHGPPEGISEVIHPPSTSTRESLQMSGPAKRLSSRRRLSSAIVESDESSASSDSEQADDEMASPPVPKKVKRITPKKSKDQRKLRASSASGEESSPVKSKKTRKEAKTTEKTSPKIPKSILKKTRRNSVETPQTPDHKNSISLPDSPGLDPITPDKKRAVQIMVPSPPLDEGVRRSKRVRVLPLEWYKGERIKYKHRDSGFTVAGIHAGYSAQSFQEKEKVEKRKEQNKFAQARRRVKPTEACGSATLSVHEALPSDVEMLEDSTVPIVNPDNNEEVFVECVKKSKAFTFKEPENLPLSICKVMQHPAFAVGQLKIDPLEEKPTQILRSDSMLFIVKYGKVAATIHRTTMILQTDDVFVIPQGNQYSIKNLRNEEASLWFFQLKN